MYQYLERKEFGSAYTTGCLGVTESDWRSLGREALDAMDLDVATKAYTRLKASFFLFAKLWKTWSHCILSNRYGTLHMCILAIIKYAENWYCSQLHLLL
jgi:hypothetical protein